MMSIMSRYNESESD